MPFRVKITHLTRKSMLSVDQPRSEARLPRFRGSADAELLAAESDRLVRDVERALMGLLQLTPASSSRPALATPVLTLRLFPRTYHQVQDASAHTQALHAFAMLVVQSKRLNAMPALKRAFWLDVLDSEMPFESVAGVPKNVLRSPAFPRFALDFHDHASFPVGSLPSWPPFVLPEEALFTFLTTLSGSKSAVAPTSHGASDVVAQFDLVFAHCTGMTVDALASIERVLDRVFAHPQRRAGVALLDMSRIPMSQSEFAVVARIAHKCRCVYQVSELRLDGIVSADVAQCSSDRTPREFLDIMCAAYGIDRLPVSTGDSITATPLISSRTVDSGLRSPSCLRTVSLQANRVRPDYFATLYSTLRYGSSLEADLSAYAPTPSDPIDEQTACWSWFAFGLLYPRPSRFAKRFRLRDIGRLVCTPDVLDAFTKTLHNPATQLVYRGMGASATTTAAATELLVCFVKKGATIEPISFRTLRESLELEAACELEALCERESDSAVCVVVPGVGLAWIQRHFVERMEREPLASAWTHQHGRYAVQLACNGTSEETAALRGLLALLGRQFSSLSFDSYRVDLSVVPAVVQYCTRLEHLSLESINLPDSDVDALVEALQSTPLRTRLQTLNLNDTCFLHDEAAQELAAVLASDSDDADNDRLALRELRLHHSVVGIDTIIALSNALYANRDLVVLQLTGPSGVFNRSLRAEQKLLTDAHDNNLLQRALPRRTKLAFLSVVTDGRHLLSADVVAQIFQFASGRDVRRVIAWTSPIRSY